jgi:hypothetical protein
LHGKTKLRHLNENRAHFWCRRHMLMGAATTTTALAEALKHLAGEKA